MQLCQPCRTVSFVRILLLPFVDRKARRASLIGRAEPGVALVPRCWIWVLTVLTVWTDIAEVRLLSLFASKADADNFCSSTAILFFFCSCPCFCFCVRWRHAGASYPIRILRAWINYDYFLRTYFISRVQYKKCHLFRIIFVWWMVQQVRSKFFCCTCGRSD